MKTLTFLLGLFALAMSTAITQASDATFPCSAADFLRLPPRDRSQPPPPPLPNCGACKDILRKCNDGCTVNQCRGDCLTRTCSTLLNGKFCGLCWSHC
ncbi:hypothetical protein HBI56_052290 [Parastagonospora nodorum]|uniref:Uncharacterized protein n=1 Tax=Phaeosphaeria nodorum (strain SN15 / ATCC MYA-4574 / FGSC 10173) TaxID=321614 RepID=A0A7U2NR56_PHANO|nr:hypothetical protein HBH56_099870 [Parastagonospora nodorum]QRD07485.1 hypothetical protein JI435_131260 [Parastagonospora nodorum SN15]KAH3930478.1 hypothetical protein HBH54_114190 [Parastagonospora nodorum]KAH3942905.1 hypothetical protein HBH53_181780 [Parastagonospora nodorum]KAH3964538.1 hypothetical protein HBH51_157880 [Parastagonospora nodorum]